MGRKPSQKERKFDQRKTNVWLEQLLPKLQSVDLQALTMDDIAKLMGKSKSTVYEYFPSKEILLMESVKLKLDTLQNLRGHLDLTAQDIKLLYVNYITMISSVVADISISFLDAIEKGFPNIWAEILGFLQGIIDDLTQLYSIGIKRGDFNKVSVAWLIAVDRFFVTKLINDSTLGSDQTLTLEQLIKEYIDIRLYGLVANS
ncbi:MAG: TetR/AcrR family transcriptional regulator [Bacteroidota bacterium]